MRGPAIAYLLPTGRCNLACPGCYATLEHAGRHSSSGELNADEYRRVIDDLVEMGVEIFDISGGEPLVYPHLLALCSAIRAHPRTRIWLVTNGTVQRPGLLPALAPLVERLVVSIDSPDAKTHDEMRGRTGAFTRSLATLRAAKTLPFAEVAVNQLVCTRNVEDVPAMVRFCACEKVDRLALLSYRDVSENGVMPTMVPPLPSMLSMWRALAAALSAGEHPQLVDLVVPAFLRPEAVRFHTSLAPALRRRIDVRHPNLRGSAAFRSSIVIRPHGEVTGDTAMVNDARFVIGSVRTGVREAWEHNGAVWQEHLARREARLREREPCGSCARWKVCRGGCPAAALHQSSTIDAHDRTCDQFRSTGAF